MISADKIVSLNEIGGRGNLEDAIYPEPGEATERDKLFLVCDGVGGENKGEVASKIVSLEFAKFFTEYPPGDDFDADAYLTKAQDYALKEMQKYAETHPDAIKMSTTLTLAYITSKGILTAWCGDSRIYYIRDGKVLWQSTDHSLVAKLVEQGEITEDEAINHSQRNIIIRSLSASGKTADIESKWLTNVHDDDYIMLCTDGVLENIDDKRIQKILTSSNPDKKSLFLSYCLGKTKDNFSLYMFRVSDPDTATKRRQKVKEKTTFPVLFFTIVVLIAVASVYLWINYFDVSFDTINIFKSHKDALKKEQIAPKNSSGNGSSSGVLPTVTDTTKQKRK